MILRLRILIALCRPAVIILLGLFAATGLAQGGAGNDPRLLAHTLVVVVAFLLFSVVLNDLADENIDRVNLAGDPSRPLVVGTATREEFRVISAVAGVVALGSAILLNPWAGVVVAAGLVLSASYSLRPVRLADRGAVASLLLPLGYVAVPYLAGVLGARGAVVPRDLGLLAGLYVGFIGRILLKDFRDVRGDALFGKRTFLVRYGRARTCAFAGACWVLGTFALLAVRDAGLALAASYAGYVVIALMLLRALAKTTNPRVEEALISAIALTGRSMIIGLIAHLAMTDARWSVVRASAVLVGFFVVSAGLIHEMVRVGPRSRLKVPTAWSAVEPDAATPARGRAGNRLRSG